MPLRKVTPGQEVAILPHCEASPDEVLEIAAIQYAGPVYIQLADGRMFATIGGNGLDTAGCIVLATDEHRAALADKKSRSA